MEIVLFIVIATTLGWLGNNWIRAKHGYALEDEWGGKTEKSVNVDNRRLEEQNERMLATMEKMQDRMAVLERIVTDRGYSVAEEIEALRDKPSSRSKDNGVPLAFAKKEEA